MKKRSIGAARREAELSAPTASRSTIVRANVSRRVDISPTFTSLYSNDTQIQTTPWDVRLIFGQIAEPATPERPTTTVTQTGEVRMSPQHAKVVVMLLIEQLKNYEEAIGAIPLPR